MDGDIESNPGPEIAFGGISPLDDETWLESSHLNFGHHLIAQKYPLAAEIIGDFDPMEFGSAIRNQDNLADVSATIKSKNVGKVLVVMPINDAITALFPGSHWGLAIYDLALSHLYFADSLNGKMFLNSTKEHVARASNLFHPHNLSVPQQNNDYDCGIFVLYVIETLYKSFNNQLLN
ncbi:hypothetical protein GEMRC1_006966 [Eukaryota sp. GEM-RC1]